jgi:hypothetical protein
MASDANAPSRESTPYLTMGLGIGAIGALSAIVAASVCPVCVVATPALLGIGLVKRWQERTKARQDSSESDAPRLTR